MGGFMKPFCFLIVLQMALMPTASEAALKPSAALREACGAEARKLCASVVSDTAKRNACMKAHHAQLSSKCKAAIKAARGKK